MTLDEYATKFSSVRMRREDGILEMTFHTNGGPLRWSKRAHEDLEQAFLAAGRDRENDVIIITGTGDEYAGPAVQPSGQGTTIRESRSPRTSGTSSGTGRASTF